MNKVIDVTPTSAFARKVAVSLVLVVLTVSTAVAAIDAQFLQGLGDTQYHYVESKGIGRSYHVYVMLPDGYDPTAKEKYPTIYLLDGGALFPLLTSYYRYLNFGEEIPNAIIVGISYGSSSIAGGNYRSSDYTAVSPERDNWGGADKFQRFLSDELIPLVETTYLSRADRRVIFGQSIGGQFVLYTALTQPDLFWGHIASNPALHRNLSFFLERHSESAVLSERPGLFVSSGTLEEPRFRGPTRQWIDHWTGRDDHPWRLKTVNLDGHTHMSAPPAAFRSGLRWLFSTDLTR